MPQHWKTADLPTTVSAPQQRGHTAAAILVLATAFASALLTGLVF
jgi:hypothetical protein